MKVKEFGAWPSRNISTGGRRSSFDEYNRASKGSERAPTAEEFASRNVKDYHHYAEQQDLTKEQDDQQEKKRQKEKEARSRRMRIIQQVAVLAVGSVMIATSYNAMVAKRDAVQTAGPDDAVVDTVPDDSENGQDSNSNDNDNGNVIGATPDEATAKPSESPTQSASASSAQSSSGGTSSTSQGGSSSAASDTSASWTWKADGTAMLVLTDSSGNVISEVAATVTTTESPAGCKTGGTITRTASAEYNGQTYTNTRNETIPALGHLFDSGTEITLSDGSTAMEFVCTRCHEHFVIKNSVSEE